MKRKEKPNISINFQPQMTIFSQVIEARSRDYLQITVE